MNIEFNQIKSFYDGKAGLIAGLSQQVNLPSIIDKHLTKDIGRVPDIPYSSLAQMMLMNIADDHQPLSRLNEYFENTDLESLLGHPVDLSKLNDDRFGGFLDAMHDAGLQQIYSEVAVSAFKRYGIKLSNINFDTTSKVMWGEYQTEEGKIGVIDVTFGYSKQKRFDKKQIKFSLGTTKGVVIDGQVLSGNLDDKTFNVNNLDRAKELKDKFLSEEEDFFYIADSAAFTKAFIQKATTLKIDVITRMTDNLVAVKSAFDKILDNLEDLERVELPTSTTPSVYRLSEDTCDYHGIPLKMAICYSEKLRPQKSKTIEKRVIKEEKELNELIKDLSKRSFACEADVELEITKKLSRRIEKIKYHTTSLSIVCKETKRRGRPSKDPNKNQTTLSYDLVLEIKRDEACISRLLDKECLFVLASTKLSMTAEEILREYKTQSAVERKFQFMKSPQFINSLYLDSPKRIESLGYLLMLLMLLLSVSEFVVRREMKKDNKTIIGPGKKVMKQPSLIAIYRVFYSVVTSSVTINGQRHRGLHQPLKENVKTILNYLGIPENIYYRGSI